MQEYLDDPNFEQNRVEYKTNKAATARGTKSTSNGRKSNAGKYNSTKVPHPLYPRPMFYDLASSMSPNHPPLPTLSEVPIASTSQGVATSSQQPGADIIDFFSAIEEEHPTSFNPQNSKYDTRLPLSKVTNPNSAWATYKRDRILSLRWQMDKIISNLKSRYNPLDLLHLNKRPYHNNPTHLAIFWESSCNSNLLISHFHPI